MAAKKITSNPVKKAAGKKPAAKKSVQKAVAKKVVAKPSSNKAAPKKSVAKTAVKKAVAKPKPVVKAPAKKAAPAKPVAKKKVAPAKQSVKSVTKKTVKPVAKKAPAKPVKSPAGAKPVNKPARKQAPKQAPAPVAKQAVKSAKPAVAPKTAPEKVAAPPKPKAKKAKKTVEQAPDPKISSKPLVTQGSGPSMPRVTPMVKVQVSTLEAGDKARYSDQELEEFRAIINAKLDEARKDYDLLKQTLANNDSNGTEDTSPSFKMIEDGSETLGREETAQLAGRQEKFIKHLEDALLRIRNKTYGICRVTGKLISKERLRLVPHATLSIEAKQQMSN